MIKCGVCNKELKNNSALLAHTHQIHGLNSKEYYDEYLKKEGDGECVVCGNGTTYRGLHSGYLKNCSVECRNNNKTIKRDYWKGKKQSKDMIQKRLKNTNQEKKEQKRKETMLDRYGEDNPSKLNEIKNKISKKLKGGKLPRTEEWQKNIIESKRKNGTLKHTDKTKKKIKKKLTERYKKDFDRTKFIKNSVNTKHIQGWYNGMFFRSSLELSFLIRNEDKNIKTAEIKEYGVKYNIDDKIKVYYPDFTDGEFIYEIKPSSLLEYHNNKEKLTAAKNKYGNKFIIITEKECNYVGKDIIYDYICNGKVKLTNNSVNILENNYKH